MNSKACIAALICIFLSACAHIPIEHRTAIQAQSSFIIVHQFGIFQAAACEGEGKNCKSTGRALYVNMGVGSGGVVDHTESSTYVLTAKHVIIPGSDKPELNGWLVEKLLYKRASQTGEKPEDVYEQITKGTIVFVPQKFEYYVEFSTGLKAKVKSTECSFRHDMCLVEVPRLVDVSRIMISEKAPYVGEKVYAASAPFGMALPSLGVVPIVDGIYSGTDIATKEHPEHSWYTMLSSPGSSGSLILNRDGDLIGVVIGMSLGQFCAAPSGCIPQRSGITIAVPHEVIKKFLDENLRK